MAHMTAQVRSRLQDHQVTLSTNDQAHQLTIPPKSTGSGSSANGAELLLLALATCYCNDIYREAAQRGIEVTSVQVDAYGHFDGVSGSPIHNITYSAVVEARASEADILALMRHTDTVAEIQSTLRLGTPVTLSDVRAVPI